jgi:hypothetical protein
MHPSTPSGHIRPKISNMPRQQSEDHACLEVYKLVVERKRLQNELDTLEQRKAKIQKRLLLLEREITRRDQEIHQTRQRSALRPNVPPPQQPRRSTRLMNPKFSDTDTETLTLEY